LHGPLIDPRGGQTVKASGDSMGATTGKALAAHSVTLLPLVFALLHAVGVVRIGVLERLDNIIYDTRLRATMPAHAG
jgi:hypothetical protein